MFQVQRFDSRGHWRKTCSDPTCFKFPFYDGKCKKHGGNRICKIDGCDRDGRSRGQCYRHAIHLRCKMEGCDKLRQGSPFCLRHGPKSDRERKRKETNRYRRNNPTARIANNCRTVIRLAMRRQMAGSKCARTSNLIGCSFSDLKCHLESQFSDGMTWKNYGIDGWHIDHLVPIASFDMMNPAEQRRCFHFSNLQPLWATDNMRKGCKIGPDWGNDPASLMVSSSNKDNVTDT